MASKRYPRGRVGGYGAPVDTTGMTPEEKETFGVTPPKPTPPKRRPTPRTPAKPSRPKRSGY